MAETILKVFVPMAIVLLMFGIGLQLVVGDFLRLARYPKAVLAGMLGQIIMLPSIAYLLVHFLSLPLAISGGIVILAACPGGVASSAMCFLARADVALALTLTAISTVLAPVVAPIIVGLGLEIIQMGSSEAGAANLIELPLAATVGQLLLVVVLPLSVGMIVRRYTERLALHTRRWFRIGNVMLMLVLLLGAFAGGLDFLLSNFQVLLPVLLALYLGSMLGGYLLARTFGLPVAQRFTLAIELSVHNVGMGLLIALNLLQQPAWIVAPAVYSIMMMLGAFALIAGLNLHRSHFSAEAVN